MNPDGWTGVAAIVAALSGGAVMGWRLAGPLLEKLKGNGSEKGGGNGSGNGHVSLRSMDEKLDRIEHEVSDREGSVRSMKHEVSTAVQAALNRLELMHETQRHSQESLGDIADTLTTIRIEAAQRGED